jgi:5-methylthioadenosine/S-adenosylhomocysteine deaminase
MIGLRMSTTLVRGKHVLVGIRDDGHPELIHDAAVLVQDHRISSTGPFADLRTAHPDAQVLGGPDHFVMPGFVNAHHHVGLTPLQLGSPDHPLELWFASRLALRDVDLYLDTLYSAFEMIASGVTTVQHLHSRAPGTPDEMLEAGETVMSAYRALGMRASYSMAVRDQNRLVYEDDATFLGRLPASLRTPLAEHLRRFTVPLDEQVGLFDTLHARYGSDPLVRVQIAPSNLHWLSDDALDATRMMADRTGAPMHMHLLETPYQKAYAARRGGCSALAYIDRFGLTGPRLTIGHGVWLTEDDIDLCAETGTRICHNGSSNLRLKSGIAPINQLREAGIPVAIGIDEAGLNDDRDMLQELRLVLRLHREPGIDEPHPSPAEVVRMATTHGADTTPFAGEIGELRAGKLADLLVVNYDVATYPYQSPHVPPLDVLVQRAKPSGIEAVMIGGEVVYSEGEFTRVDRKATLIEIARLLEQPLTPAEEQRRRLAEGVMPYVRRFYDGYLDDLTSWPHQRPSSRY